MLHHKNVFAVHGGPVATLTIPVAVLIAAPVSIVPVGIGMDHCGVGSGLDCGSSSSGMNRVSGCSVGRGGCASVRDRSPYHSRVQSTRCPG